MQSREDYIPGFDWVRLFGSILVVLAHFGVFEGSYESFPTLYRILSFLVPVFFIMSGFLRKRHFSKEALFKQVLTYGAVYLAVDYFTVLYSNVLEWLNCGEFSLKVVAVNLLKGFVCHYPYAPQLWFIPALLYPMMLNAFLNDRTRKIVIAGAAALYVSTIIVGDACMNDWLEELIRSFPLLEKATSRPELFMIWRYFLIGLLFTTIGFDIDTWKIKPAWLLFAAVPFVVIELSTSYLGVSFILLSILFFYLVRRLPGQFLYPFHREISLFSCLMYFLHIIEMDLFSIITDSIPLNFFLITAFNMALTLAVTSYIRGKRQEAKL